MPTTALAALTESDVLSEELNTALKKHVENEGELEGACKKSFENNSKSQKVRN